MDKPNALRLADALDRWHEGVFPCEAADELRRLVAENELLASALDKLRSVFRDERMELLRQRDQATAQRDELLAALKQALEECIWPSERLSDVCDKARAAIAKAEEQK
jgi:hypothetical protein